MEDPWRDFLPHHEEDATSDLHWEMGLYNGFAPLVKAQQQSQSFRWPGIVAWIQRSIVERALQILSRSVFDRRFKRRHGMVAFLITAAFVHLYGPIEMLRDMSVVVTNATDMFRRIGDSIPQTTLDIWLNGETRAGDLSHSASPREVRNAFNAITISE